ncbi:conjugal transfer protein [Streptomyces sp. NPDC021100]|uniref:conjugal transfer protein n=1 Tax=Streptomyces sp. NPDC021100 TaxID=3365114 RepID=UPI00378927C5
MSWWRKVLNLPEKQAAGGDELADALASRAQKTLVEQAAPETAVPQQPHPLGWAEEEESSGRAFARRAGRVAVWTVIALAAFTGVKSWFFPAQPKALAPKAEAGADEAKKDKVPVEEAQQVAARFARSYLTWSEKAPEARDRELAADLAKGEDAKLGWDGHGEQQVAQTIPGAVTQAGGRRARVMVSVRVSVTALQGKQQQTVSSWRGLEVPVAATGNRVIVTGQPALVGMPGPVSYKPAALPETDSEMSSATQQAVKDFLTAWAAGNEAQAAAPGAQIAPLGGQMQLNSLDGWTVDTGSGEQRTGTATVRWKVGGSLLQQTYRITLTKVSAGGSARWQVAALTAKSG